MIYGSNYTLKQEDTFLIYGAATTGGTIYTNLTKNGFRVAAFMDQRAYEIDSYYSLPVLSMAEGQSFAEQNDIIVIIAIKNVFEHEKIAAKLLNSGFHNVLFRPYRILSGKGTEADLMLERAYDKVLYEKGTIEGTAFPVISHNERWKLEDQAILVDEGEYVTANIPLPYVFTDNRSTKSRWIDIPCLGLLPHIGLFETFNGTLNRNYLEYIKFCHESAEKRGGIVTSKAWEMSVYQNRMDVFLHMQYSWEHDPDFFVRNAVEGIYNPKGYFNIVSGKHRITYMLVKGRRYIPLRIKKENYLIWRDQLQAERILALIEKNKSDILPMILRNPYFYHYPSNSTAFYEKVLYTLISQIFQNQYDSGKDFEFSGKQVLFYNTPLALYSDVFQMMGFSIVVVEEDAVQKQLINAVLPDICIHSSEILARDSRSYYIAVLQKFCESQQVDANITVSISCESQSSQEIAVGSSNGELMHAGLIVSHKEKR